MLRSGYEHSPMRIASPFIMIIHVIGSLRVIHQFARHPGCPPGVLRILFASLELRNRRDGYVRLRERSYS
jgi:hypothetical protein